MREMNRKLQRVMFAIYLLIIWTSAQLFAQAPGPTKAASADKIKKALTVVEANMDSLKAHRTYIYAMGLENPDVLNQYEIWFKKYPKNVNIPLAIGSVYHGRSMPQAREFLLKTAAMDPENAKIWAMLSDDAYYRADKELSMEYLRKAALADPTNAGYAYGEVVSFEQGDPHAYSKKVFDFARRFPTDQRGAQAIYWLAARTVNLDDKIRYYEALRELYPPFQFEWSSSGMIGLADAYLQTDTKKALVLIDEMGGEGDWKIRKQVAELFDEVHKLEQEQKYAAAIRKLDEVKLPRFNYINDFLVLRKTFLQEKGGNMKVAYDSLAVKFAKLPSDAFYTKLQSLGKKLGKDKEQVHKDIEILRDSSAIPAYPFDLGLYTSDEKLNMNKLKGKVILLTFWFPGCGPCREEFPHLQTVVDSFKNDSLVYVGINVIPSQDGYVLPFMKNTKYSFIPLRGSFSYAQKNYDVYGAPKNFVIDKDGKIVFKDFIIDNSNHRTLELMLSSLLEK